MGFVTHGNPEYFPPNMRGAAWNGMAHGTDWYVSLLMVAGVSPDALATGTGPLPPDGLNIIPALLGNRSSPRHEIVHNIDEKSRNAMHVGAIRVGAWKLIKGYPGCTTKGADTPTNPSNTKGGCYNGVDFVWKPPEMTQPGFDTGVPFTTPPPCSVRPCLFNVEEDSSEQHDRATEEPAKVQELLARYQQLRESEVSLEEAQLCLTGTFKDGCRANLGTGVWAPWLD